MNIVLKQTQFRFGRSQNGVVVAFSKEVYDIEASMPLFDDADCSTQWSSYITKYGSMISVNLEICWDKLGITFHIPFDMKIPEHRDIVKQVATDKKINFVNTDDFFSDTARIGCGIFAEVNKVQVLQWLELDDLGVDIRNYTDDPKPRFKVEE